MDMQPPAIESSHESLTRIKVIGVGGGGSNAVNNMVGPGIDGVDFIAVNTDAGALSQSVAPARLRIGDKLTKGLGVGGDPKLGAAAAEESREDLAAAIQGAGILFITAGMGGGTGTGAAPVIAEIAGELSILTIAVVTRPFTFEGTQRTKVALEGVARLTEKADTVIAIPNDRLLSVCDPSISIDAAFKMVDSVLRQSVLGICEVIRTVGHINLDLNDVKAIMSKAGRGWIGVGRGTGGTRAIDAAKAAIVNPLFDFTIEKAKRILFNIKGNDLTMSEVNEAANVIKQVADPEAQIIFGFGADPELNSVMKITLVATEFSEGKAKILVNRDELFELAGDGRRYSFLNRLK